MKDNMDGVISLCLLFMALGVLALCVRRCEAGAEDQVLVECAHAVTASEMICLNDEAWKVDCGAGYVACKAELEEANRYRKIWHDRACQCDGKELREAMTEAGHWHRSCIECSDALKSTPFGPGSCACECTWGER